MLQLQYNYDLFQGWPVDEAQSESQEDHPNVHRLHFTYSYRCDQ